VLCGENSFKQQFYLPDHMSADELCDRLTEEALRQREKVRGQTQTSSHSCGSRLSNGAKRNFLEIFIDKIHRDFAQPIAESDPARIKQIQRDRLRLAIGEARIFDDVPIITRSAEGRLGDCLTKWR
jgi:hypothetical protein